MGKARQPAAAAKGSALSERLSVRRHLSGPRRRGSLVLPAANSRAMQAHLEEISRTVRRGAHAVLLLDRAGWHTTGKLTVPNNLSLIFLPSRAPELNPVENLWQHLRQTYLSNRVFDSYDAILDACCEAWLRITAQPWQIRSIGMRKWAHTGQYQ